MMTIFRWGGHIINKRHSNSSSSTEKPKRTKRTG